VLEKGKIIEEGNHEELLALKGKYYQLYTGAFELD
jgi:ATP-binding cassette subfamily B protein